MKGENIIYHTLCQVKNMKNKIFKSLFVVPIIITMLLSESLAASFSAGVVGRTYTSEAGATYSASDMQNDYNALVNVLSSDGGSVASSFDRFKSDSWFKSQYGFWYYFVDNRTTTKKGWFNDHTDGQRYYLDPTNNGVMLVGWQMIDGYWYYFNESHNNEVNWYDTGNGWYESLGKRVVGYGSMLRNTVTPDGKFVDENGRLIENTGSEKQFDKKLEREYLNNKNNAKFDNDGNLWILSYNEILGGPGERITIKYANSNKIDIFEKSGYSSGYDDGGHIDEYLTIIDGIQREESVNEYKGGIPGVTAQKVNSTFMQYYQMVDAYK